MPDRNPRPIALPSPTLHSHRVQYTNLNRISFSVLFKKFSSSSNRRLATVPACVHDWSCNIRLEGCVYAFCASYAELSWEIA